MHRRTGFVGALVAAVAAIGAVQLAPGAAPSARAAGLTSYSGCDELLAAYRSELERSATTGVLGWPERMAVSDTAPGAATSGMAARDSAATGAVGSGPTGTNLQEQGVDEPDLAKLRDGRLVVLTGTRLAAGPEVSSGRHRRTADADAHPARRADHRGRAGRPDR